ncbi:hypothetical protein TPY_2031 [Sulfobacillus acidophilus TPY]|nr:hypothetical protein TPY_2031 [Sulfobacillus acidophilus TPY]
MTTLMINGFFRFLGVTVHVLMRDVNYVVSFRNSVGSLGDFLALEPIGRIPVR